MSIVAIQELKPLVKEYWPLVGGGVGGLVTWHLGGPVAWGSFCAGLVMAYLFDRWS